MEGRVGRPWLAFQPKTGLAGPIHQPAGTQRDAPPVFSSALCHAACVPYNFTVTIRNLTRSVPEADQSDGVSGQLGGAKTLAASKSLFLPTGPDSDRSTFSVPAFTLLGLGIWKSSRRANRHSHSVHCQLSHRYHNVSPLPMLADGLADSLNHSARHADLMCLFIPHLDFSSCELGQMPAERYRGLEGLGAVSYPNSNSHDPLTLVRPSEQECQGNLFCIEGREL